jgi:hypothetical protein
MLIKCWRPESGTSPCGATLTLADISSAAVAATSPPIHQRNARRCILPTSPGSGGGELRQEAGPRDEERSENQVSTPARVRYRRLSYEGRGGSLKKAPVNKWGRRMPIDSADSTRLKSDTATDIGEKVLRWFAQIGAAVIKPIKYFLRTRYPASDEKCAESTLGGAGAIAAATENTVLTTTESFTVPVNTEVKVDTDAQIDSAAPPVIDQEEIQRRRDLVRTLFNDFWSGAYEKPAAFAARLDQAEDYVNERLSARGEFWQLDAKTRVTLGLPPRANLPNNEKNHADLG